MTVFLPHLETNLTLRCQLRCKNCNHFVGLDAHKSLPDVTPDGLAHDLERLANVAHTQAWGALGGEPTLHPDLVELLHIVRASGIADSIEVWTNGLTAHHLPMAFWEALDVFQLSAYPGKITDDDVKWMATKCADTGVEFRLKDQRNAPYFTALLGRKPKSAEAAKAKYEECWFRTFTRVVDNGYFYQCCTSPFIAPLIMGLEVGHDGLSLDGITEESLLAFLSAEEPLAGCTFCLAHNGPHQPWMEVKGPEAWLEASRI
jgi:organic radical activating enzyme